VKDAKKAVRRGRGGRGAVVADEGLDEGLQTRRRQEGGE
jgi:hypothetical protein